MRDATSITAGMTASGDPEAMGGISQGLGGIHAWHAERWTVIVPFFNERAHLPSCIASLARQDVPFRLVLVDNASTDGSGAVALAVCAAAGVSAELLVEQEPGKVAALRTGLAATGTEFVATCDADTLYPPDYLSRAGSMLDRGAVAAVAATQPPGASRWQRRFAGWKLELTSKLLPQQCLNGGAGQVFRTSALRAAGGFDPQIWNWVLEDHEIMARIEQQGRIAYHRHFECAPLERSGSGPAPGWRFHERILYHCSRAANRKAFFHGYLAGKLRARALSSERLRRHESQLSHA